MITDFVCVYCNFSILCSDYAIKRIDEPFVKDGDNPGDWAI